ncbi:MAG TPA: putative quinol monooxygenase [Xanthobacteraceae bacterium]
MSHVIVARWRPREGEAETIAAILRELTKAVRTEPGNLQFDAHRSLEDPNEFAIYEVYRSEQAFLDHRQTAHFKTLVLERAVPLLAVREIRTYSPLA